MADFYFYLNDPYLPSPTLTKIKTTQLSDVIKRNTSLSNIQYDVFFMSACVQDTVDNGSFVDTTEIESISKVVPQSRNFRYYNRFRTFRQKYRQLFFAGKNLQPEWHPDEIAGNTRRNRIYPD